jgi:hypothetical protein
MIPNDMSNVEHVADIKELEDLLNDSLAKQRVNVFHFFCFFVNYFLYVV